MRILTVDDDPIILELLTEVLASIGQTDVTVANSAAEVFELVSGDVAPFDCFLLDIQMPDIDGIQLCTALRTLPQYRRTPILMITAMSDKAYIDNAFAAGATDYITKPFDVIELGARIRTAESLANARRYQTRKISLVKEDMAKSASEKPYTLEEKLPIHDVDGVIEYTALENYVSQLSRGDLFGSTVQAFSITEIDRIFNSASAYDFECMITDVAEAITSCLKCVQHLVSYAGNGTFVCVYSGSKKQHPDYLESHLREVIASMELSYSDGRPIVFRIVSGASYRLTFRAGGKAAQALQRACISAENNDLGMYKFAKRSIFHNFIIGQTG